MIHFVDTRVVVGEVFARQLSVWQIGGYVDLIERSSGAYRVLFGMKHAFVSDVRVENGEERFSFWSILPMSFIAAIIPAWCFLVYIVVLFTVVGRIVASFAEVFWVDFYVGRQGSLAAHVFATD